MPNEERPALIALAAAAVLMAYLFARPLGAQSPQPHCAVVCAPTVALMPAVLRSHLFGGPRVRSLAGGPDHRLPSTSNMEMLIAGAAKTALPRVSLFGSVQWLPNASEARNPFTLYTASELGGRVRANAPTVTFGLSGAALDASQTHGVVDVDVNAGDLFSQAARPGDRSAYTHKLDLDLVTHWHVFAWTPPKSYAHRLTVFAILDYVASGLPRSGDAVPQGRVFLDDARPTSLIAGLALPIAAGGK